MLGRTGSFNKDLGNKGEELARKFLIQKGYRPLSSKYWTRWGEIDLVMQDGDTLVFVEVKRRSNDQYGRPEEAVMQWKQAHMIKAALVYIKKNRYIDKAMRFDVVSIEPTGVRHVPDAFQSTGEYYY